MDAFFHRPPLPVRPDPSLGQAKEALKLFLRGLPPCATFDVIGFGSTHKPLFGSPRQYDDDSLDAATRRAAVRRPLPAESRSFSQEPQAIP